LTDRQTTKDAILWAAFCIQLCLWTYMNTQQFLAW